MLSIGEHNVNGTGDKFWDCVVITASDDDQRLAYDLQVEEKRRRGEIPPHLPVHVVADTPPSVKIGNGGSVMVALDHLHTTYGNMLSEMRVVLIPAGGQSKRLVSSAAAGKVFTALPIKCAENPRRVYDSFDLCLLKCLPFLERMSPGIFLVCPDTLEVYDPQELSDSDGWHFHSSGFTALAHPSSVQVGTSHGVYVPVPGVGQTDAVEFRECNKVLQKPSLSQMKENGAIYKGKGQNGTDFCYSDSCFFFDMEITRKLVEFYRKTRPLQCEIDAFGDFLQAAGKLASPGYVHNVDNVSQSTEQLIPTRLSIYKLLEKSPIHVVMLNNSYFYHIGTTQEYLHHFCENQHLRKALNFTRHSLVVCDDEDVSSLLGCSIHCRFTRGCATAARSITEFCEFNSPVIAGADSIISNCAVDVGMPQPLVLPPGLYLHTVPVKLDNRQATGYATIFLHVHDDLKRVHNEAASVHVLRQPVQRVMASMESLGFQLNLERMFGDGVRLFSLWNMRLFPVCYRMCQSFLLSAAICRTVFGLEQQQDMKDTSDLKLLSIAEILQVKDVKELVDWRRKLHDSLVSGDSR